jgi:hypothetical protein
MIGLQCILVVGLQEERRTSKSTAEKMSREYQFKGFHISMLKNCCPIDIEEISRPLFL